MSIELFKSLTDQEKERYFRFHNYIKSWCERAETKFIEGMIEHRGESLDAKKEAEEEVMDILAYNFLADESVFEG